ncbi:MAG TPA: alpha-2-macroglobulin family protein, partial [Labilithrix sp.]
FSTYGPLKLQQGYCGWWGNVHCVPLQSFELYFSNPIDLKTFDKKLVSVTPAIPNMKIEVNGNTITIHGKTKGRTHYDVRVAGTIGDVHGQTMGDEGKTQFDVGSADPAMFGAERDMVVLDPASPKVYTVYTINEPGLRTRIFKVEPADWEKYVKFAQEWERPRKIAPPGKLVVDKVVTTKKAPDELVSTPLDLAPALTGGLGQVLVVVEPTGPLPKDTWRPELHVWVQSTDLGVDALVESDQITGWVTKLQDGAPVEGVDLQLLGAGSAKTDKEGLARVALQAKEGKLVVAKQGKDTAIVPEQWFGVPSYQLQPRSDEVRWLVFDDRGMYKPGEDVRVKGFVRRAGMSRGGDLDRIPDAAGKTISFTVRDPRGAEIGKGTSTVDDQGGFDLQFKLPNNANLGSANVEMSIPVALGSDTFQHGFEIQEFRRPEFEVTAHSSEGPHFVGKHAVATVDAKYYSGGGLADAPVNWSVTRSTGTFTPPNRSDFHFGPEPSYFWSWRTPNDPKKQPKTETWTSHTNPQGTHRMRIDFDALDPPYPMSLALTAMVEDVNRQQWAGRTSILVHPSDYYVGLRLNKQFIRAGENIDVDLVVTDVDGKRVPGRKVAVKAARLDWEQVGAEYEEKEVDVQTCDTTVPESGPTETVRCSMRAANGGSWKVWAVVEDEHGRKNQSATQLWVMSNDMPKDRSLDKGKATIVLDKKEYKPGELAELLVVAPFAPAEGILTVRRQGIVHLERFSMKTLSTALKVKLEDAYVPNVGISVQLVGQDVRENANGDPDPSLPKRLAYASGNVGVNVLPVGRTLGVKATPKAPALEPGSSTSIDVDVKDPQGKGVADAEVAVIVADEAVLALSGYTTPDPIAVFYAGRDTSLHELAIRDRVLLSEPDLAKLRPQQGQFRAGPGGVGRGHFGGLHAGAGGGAMPPPAAAPAASTAAFDAPMLQKVAREEAPADKKKSAEKADRDDDQTKAENKPSSVSEQKTPIAMRKDFSALALFAPRVRTDGAGHATVQLKLPDNLTRYRVMAIAASGDKMFGGGESTITARLPLQVRPSAPRFLNFGDKFELPVVVQNQTDAPVDVGIVVRATNATIDSPDAKRVKIAPNDRAEVRFGAAAVKAGTARFQIGVAAGSFADASEIELPVYTPATTEAFATYGEVDEGATAQLVKMPPNVFPQFGGLEVTTSSTQLQALTDAVLYLVKYPFECNEQISSRVITIAALRDVLAAFKVKDMPKPEVLLASMQGDFEKLKRRQHYDGGWGFWQETPWPYLTVHVTHALVRAKEKGFKPDEQMLARAQGYLRSIETKFPPWYEPEWRRAITAYALYVRKRMGDADPQTAKRLIQEAGGVDKTPIETLGWLWPTISEDKNSTAENEAIRRFVANRVTETAGNAHFVSGYQDGDWVLLSSDRRADGVLLEAMIGDQPQSTLIPKLVSGLLAHRKAGHWTNTQENAFVLLALDRYFHEYEKITPDFVARVWLGDRFAGEHAFKGRTTERDQIAIPMQWLATETKGAPQNLVLAKDGPGRMYYRIGMQYAPTDLKLPPVDAGFVVQREYEGAENPADVKRDPDGTWRIKAGAKVRIRVQMVNQSRRYHVALVDNLPAGLEPMNPALAVTGEIPKDPKETTSKGKGRYWYWSQTWYEHQNMRDERVEAFASLLWEGVWDYTYVAKATTPGTFVAPPPKAEEMYAPETFGRGAGDRVVIE